MNAKENSDHAILRQKRTANVDHDCLERSAGGMPMTLANKIWNKIFFNHASNKLAGLVLYDEHRDSLDEDDLERIHDEMQYALRRYAKWGGPESVKSDVRVRMKVILKEAGR
jgi:hypothetical protein